MSNSIGYRLIFGVLVLSACLAVYVTVSVSGQSPPTGQHHHCNPFDLDCDADATPVPTARPTAVPTAKPTAVPTARPTRPGCDYDPELGEWVCPTPKPAPTEVPTAVPTKVPTKVPTEVPTAVPTKVPTAVPTATGPTATLSASRSTIAPRLSTIVYADVEPTDTDTSWDDGGLSRSACPGGTSGTGEVDEFPPPQIRLWGCTTGEYTVALNLRNGTELATIVITVTGNIPPAFGAESYSFSVTESSASGTQVGTVSATDGNTGDTVSYSITAGNSAGKFTINASTGAITVSGALDHETAASYSLTVTASDSNGGSDTATVTVAVTDENEPVVFGEASYNFSVSTTAAVDTAVGTVSATDPDGDTVSYSITAGNSAGKFAIGSGTGAITVASSPGASPTSYSLTVTGSDGRGGAANVAVNIAVSSSGPTATATPTTRAGAVSATPKTIAVGQVTTITATWRNVASTTKLSFGPQLGKTCASSQGHGVQGSSVSNIELVAKESQTLTGCATGTATVQLLDGSTVLDSVDVMVVARPVIIQTRRVGYRWFNIGWTAARPYTSFAVEWRNEGSTGAFVTLPTTGDKGARAIMSGMAAAIRGIPYENYENKKIELRLVAQGSGGLEGRSETLRYSRHLPVDSIGHGHDHVLMYDLSWLAHRTINLARYLENEAAASAGAWAAVDSTLGLETCKGTLATISTACPQNTDRSVLQVVIGDCPVGDACYDSGTGEGIEGHLSGLRRIIFEEIIAPKEGVEFTWTDLQRLDGKIVPTGGRYKWVTNTYVHEFGHAFGLIDRYEKFPDGSLNPYYIPNYDGIMSGSKTGKKDIGPDSETELKEIYKTHTKGHGW